jgi:hypothetical protein
LGQCHCEGRCSSGPKQSPFKRVKPFDESQPLNRRLLRRQEQAARNDMALRAEQAETERELRLWPLLPSVLDRAFKGEL